MRFPLFIDLVGKSCLVVGAGEVADRKVKTLMDFGAEVTIVSPALNHPFEESDLDGQALVVAATDNREVNRLVSVLCEERGIPVNVVDDPELCSFHFPSLAVRGDLVVAVSSDGKCPVATQWIRDRAEKFLTDDLVATVERLGAERQKILQEYPDLVARREYYRKELAKCSEVED